MAETRQLTGAVPGQAAAKPVLWHIPISHYSEKVRWALDYKGIEHQRRVTVPGYHMLVALALTRGRQITFPVLVLDQRPIGDSSAIIAALERRHPDPPLYPSEPAERRRALALEEFADDQLGPHVRRFAYHEARRDRARFAEWARRESPPALARLGPLAPAYARAFTAMRFGAGSEAAAKRSRARVERALDRLERELGANRYLVGDRFTIADLAAASLLYPLVLPPEGPKLRFTLDGIEDRPERLAEHPTLHWVREMFRRHRRRGILSADAGDPAGDGAGAS
ncbi:MAG: glutathione S-transferase family protein [Solirubrobacterales bacterium]|nr:glutathione S-transferase family protein [Solirubrobacterales bacterium]